MDFIAFGLSAMYFWKLVEHLDIVVLVQEGYSEVKEGQRCFQS